MGQPRDNKPSFMQVLRLPIHPSLRGRELPRPTRSTHRLPNPTDTDLGHHASIQMTTGRRRTLITGRTILAPVGTTILTRVINWGARPRTRLVPAVPATSGCRHRRCHAGGSQARRGTRSHWLPWPLPADRRRSCPRAYLVTSPRFEGDTFWPLSQIAAYDLERRVGDLATQ